MTPTQFIVEVENRLGWTPPVSRQCPLWKARSIEAMKLKKAMASKRCSFDDLLLALEYCVRRREPATPTALCWRVDDAKQVAAPKVVDIDEQAQDAIAWEMNHDTPDAEKWITRLVRTRGDARVVTLSQWADHRGVDLASQEITVDA